MQMLSSVQRELHNQMIMTYTVKCQFNKVPRDQENVFLITAGGGYSLWSSTREGSATKGVPILPFQYMKG